MANTEMGPIAYTFHCGIPTTMGQEASNGRMSQNGPLGRPTHHFASAAYSFLEPFGIKFIRFNSLSNIN
ncbi:hypothetical protein COLO4_25889 [Corchorus olitorius]|uniref:Uncharacterized protein n=1 Tax=Corchorus olitorius TaxID=93759 RepID=A0A1R3HZI8_9ROSI|nr:hypothetical protein COLO4_25889 [Corchorus olitorius]